MIYLDTMALMLHFIVFRVNITGKESQNLLRICKVLFLNTYQFDKQVRNIYNISTFSICSAFHYV